MRGVQSLLNLAAGLASRDSPQESSAQHCDLRGSMAIDALASAQIRVEKNQRHIFQRRPAAFVPVIPALLTAMAFATILAVVFGIA